MLPPSVLALSEPVRTRLPRRLSKPDRSSAVPKRFGTSARSGVSQLVSPNNFQIKPEKGLFLLTSPLAARKGKRTLEDLQAFEAVNHNMTGAISYDMFTPLGDVFSANTSCILAPYITNGPYYVAGEKMRSNVKDTEFSDGIDMFLEVQYINVNTCEAIPSVAIDIWNCNATGVYSGVESGQAGLNTTFLRGIQLTDFDGVASFETIVRYLINEHSLHKLTQIKFPGHYSGRAAHTHLLAHTNASLQSNGTISVWGAPVAHIGQLFYPEDLRAEVEATAPYTQNTQPLTTNDEDMWSVLQADESFDPIPQFVYLGESIEDGLFAWIQIGINASADYTTDSYYGVAAYYAEDGGHSTGASVPGGGAGGAPGGNGTVPSGFPSGSASGAAPTSTA